MWRAIARRHPTQPFTLVSVLAAALVALLPAGASLAQQTPSSAVNQTSTVGATPSSPALASTASTVPSTAGPASSGAPSTPEIFADAGAAQPFPAPLVATVPAAEVPVERLMTNVYMTASTDPERPQVVVQFKSPFTLPARPYRVSVVVGDPSGARLRASMIGNGAGVVSWKEEKAAAPPPGAPWAAAPNYTTVDTNADGATFSPAGIVAITVPLKDAPAGSAVWAEVESGTDGKQVSISPYFSRPALFDEVVAQNLPSSLVGTVINGDGTPSGQYIALPAGPVLTLQNRAMVVTTAERTPETLLGQKVEKAYDFVRIAPTFNKRAVVTDYIFIDRSTGDVKLLDGFTVPPGDKTGTGTWIAAGLDKADPGAPVTVRFDLRGIAQGLGITMSPGATGFGLRRELVLADGRRVVAEAVLGTVAWFGADQIEGIEQPAALEAPPVGPLVNDSAGDATSRVATIAGIAAAALLLVFGSLAIVVRRRRKKVRGDAADQLDLIAEETAQHRAVQREERRATGPVPVVRAEPVRIAATKVPAPEPEPAAEPAQVPAPAPAPEGLAALAAVGRTPSATAEATVSHGADEPRAGAAPSSIDAEPTWADDHHTSGDRPIIAAPRARPGGGAPNEPSQGKLKSTFKPDAGDAPEPPSPADPPARKAPAQVLESLGAEFDELSERLRRLADGPPGTPDDAEMPDAGSRRG